MRDTSIIILCFSISFKNIMEENYCELPVQLQQSGVLQQQHVRPQYGVLRLFLQRRQYFYEIS